MVISYRGALLQLKRRLVLPHNDGGNRVAAKGL
jgi:hypothetical protein